MLTSLSQLQLYLLFKIHTWIQKSPSVVTGFDAEFCILEDVVSLITSPRNITCWYTMCKLVLIVFLVCSYRYPENGQHVIVYILSTLYNQICLLHNVPILKIGCKSEYYSTCVQPTNFLKAYPFLTPSKTSHLAINIPFNPTT